MYKKFYSLFLLLGLAVGFTSCDQEDVDPATDTAALATFTTLATSVTSNSVASTDATTPPTKPQCVGKRSKLTEIDVAALPGAITTYLSENYAGATVERAGTTTQGGFVVQLALADGTKSALLFDASGAFVAVDSHQRGTEVAPADLPASITAYVTTTYSGSSILKAKKDADGKFVVVVQKNDGTIVGLAFTAEGAFTSELSLQGKFGCDKGGKKGPKKGK